MNRVPESWENSIDLENILKETSTLREVTYAYLDLKDWTYFNETILAEYIWLDLWKDKETFFDYINKNFNWDKNKFLISLKKQCTQKLDTQIQFLVDQLSVSPELWVLISALEFTKNWLDFELEKAWLEHWLSEEEVSKKVELQYKYDAELFWERVSENVNFLSKTYSFLLNKYNSTSHELSEQQASEITSNLDVLKNTILKLGGDVEHISDYIHEPQPEWFEKFHDIRIDRDDYVKMKNALFEVSDVPQRCKVWNFWSFYDGDDFYGVPNIDSYETRTLGELLLLMPHETNHYINLKVTNDRWDIKRPWDMIKEEWAAKAVEKKIMWIENNDIQSMTLAWPSVVLAQLLDGESFLKFQDSYYDVLKLAWSVKVKWDIQKLSLRKKRWFPLYGEWWPNKDAAYALWLWEMMDFFENWGSIENTFSWKTSVDDMKSWKFNPENFWNQHISHILFTELIIFSLQFEWNIGSNNFHSEFVEYMQDKYKEFAADFGFIDESEKFSFMQRKKLLEVLDIIKKSKQKSIDEDREYMIADFTD